MDKGTLRIVFTILIYAGILVCVTPHLTGLTEAASIFLAAGILIAVVSSILRCFCMEDESHTVTPKPDTAAKRKASTAR